MSKLRPTRGGILVICVLALSTSGCGDDVDRIARTIEQATADIVNESGNWRTTVTTLQKTLAADASELAQDASRQIQNISDRSIATGGGEIRCDTDFLIDRVTTQLENVARKLRKVPEKDVSPFLCQAAPNHVDLRLEDKETDVIDIYGYDFPTDKSRDLRVIIKQVGSSSAEVPVELDVTDKVLDVVHHYRATLRVSGGGLRSQLTSSARSVVLKWRDKQLGSIAVLDGPPTVSVTRFASTSTRTNHPSSRVTIPDDYVLVGGGCFANWIGSGQLLTASYPSDRGWTCQAKDHDTADPASLTAYALAVPKVEGLEVKVVSATGAVAAHPHGEAVLPAGYDLLGGGCATSWVANTEGGNMLVDSAPNGAGWRCEGKDHRTSSAASITAYAIGLKRSPRFKIVEGTASSAQAAHPSAVALLPESDPHASVVSGGCDVTYAGAGSMLTATMPSGLRGWECKAKDHWVGDAATVQAFVRGVVRQPR